MANLAKMNYNEGIEWLHLMWTCINKESNELDDNDIKHLYLFACFEFYYISFDFFSLKSKQKFIFNLLFMYFLYPCRRHRCCCHRRQHRMKKKMLQTLNVMAQPLHLFYFFISISILNKKWTSNSFSNNDIQFMMKKIK